MNKHDDDYILESIFAKWTKQLDSLSEEKKKSSPKSDHRSKPVKIDPIARVGDKSVDVLKDAEGLKIEDPEGNMYTITKTGPDTARLQSSEEEQSDSSSTSEGKKKRKKHSKTLYAHP